jgi:alpha-glucuronidase
VARSQSAVVRSPLTRLPWRRRRVGAVLLAGLLASSTASAEDGYELWLRYPLVSDAALLQQYRQTIASIVMLGDSPTLRIARDELRRGLRGLLGRDVPVGREVAAGALVVGSVEQFIENRVTGSSDLREVVGPPGGEGYGVRSTVVAGRRVTAIAGQSDVAALYGVFHLLRLLQTHQRIDALAITESPRAEHRVLNHWDNLDGTVERGYAGGSLWDWHKLPDYLSPRYVDYARANASLGINGTVLTNVNANATSLTRDYLAKAAALAHLFRPYGIRVYLTARFSAPIEIGGLKTADPLDPQVRAWWAKKADEIYALIPDFGGFLVKANSEGQPGPQDYKRTHADGANMLAEAVGLRGIVIWRAFVYSENVKEDRARQAYTEFVPLDGTFRPNVLVQVKNGPIDFQPREPIHPLFGAMPKTPLMLELQVTKEYLGFATHLVYLAPLFEEVLDAPVEGPPEGGPRVRQTLSGFAGVANTGTDRNWCGAVFACANWHAFGRLAWNPTLTSSVLAREWLRMTFTNDTAFVEPATQMMLGSRQAAVDYMTPLGLHHLMARGHHYGPGPWVSGGPRADWTSVYYHQADAKGIGFDRTVTGSNAVEQYPAPLRDLYGRLDRVPDDFLLWFHHLPWDHRMRSGRMLWDELTFRYCRGVQSVGTMKQTWQRLERFVDADRFGETRAFLDIQEKEAKWWRDASVLYFQTFAKRPIADACGAPERTLDEYMSIDLRYVPGN